MGTSDERSTPAVEKEDLGTVSSWPDHAYTVTHLHYEQQIPQLAGFDLDAPHRGDQGNEHVLRISGWAVGRDKPAVAVEVAHQGIGLKIVHLAGGRPDVGKMFPDYAPDSDCSFFLPVGLLGLKRESNLVLKAILEGGERVPMLRIRVVREPLHTGFQPTIQPLIVTSLGRSGSTWLMKMLSRHPEVVAQDEFPYEHAPARYWVHMLMVLSDPSNLGQSAAVADFPNNLWWVGNNPFYDDTILLRAPLANWFGRTYPEQLGAFCQWSIDSWYTKLAQYQEKDHPVYFAEKQNPGFHPVLTRELYPEAKEIFLVRDFRDMACSIFAFNEKRGFHGFGHSESLSREDYVRHDLRWSTSQLRRAWRSRSERSHLVRYEALVQRPNEELTELLDYLEIDSSPAVVRTLLESAEDNSAASMDNLAGAEARRVHRTSADLAASVGRWKRETRDSMKPMWDEAFGEALVDFGYELDG